MKININAFGFTEADVESDDVDVLARMICAACEAPESACYIVKDRLLQMRSGDIGHFHFKGRLISRQVKA